MRGKKKGGYSGRKAEGQSRETRRRMRRSGFGCRVVVVVMDFKGASGDAVEFGVEGAVALVLGGGDARTDLSQRQLEVGEAQRFFFLVYVPPLRMMTDNGCA